VVKAKAGKPGDMVLLKWHDSMRTTGWRTTDEALAEVARDGVTLCRTVGVLVGENEDRIMVALNAGEPAGGEPMVGETITIPKSALVSRQRLRT
jgi:hypothetical protein